jgi:hypothetical protein
MLFHKVRFVMGQSIILQRYRTILRHTHASFKLVDDVSTVVSDGRLDLHESTVLWGAPRMIKVAAFA